jgi:hypothetical protein
MQWACDRDECTSVFSPPFTCHPFSRRHALTRASSAAPGVADVDISVAAVGHAYSSSISVHSLHSPRWRVLLLMSTCACFKHWTLFHQADDNRSVTCATGVRHAVTVQQLWQFMSLHDRVTVARRGSCRHCWCRRGLQAPKLLAEASVSQPRVPATCTEH